MELTGHLRNHRLRLTGVVVASTLCAALVAAPSASAKVGGYTADLKPPGGGDGGFISFKLKSKKNKQTKKFNPVLIKKLSVSAVAKCTDGEEAVSPGFHASLAPWPTLIPVSGRKFSLSDSSKFEVDGGTQTYTIDFSGRIPRHGPPVGTLRYRSSGPQFVDGDPNSPSSYVQVSCDTGPMTWTGKPISPNFL
jgi:hypothetical protein